LRSAPQCQISRLSGQRVAPVGRKTHFWTLSKNNTGMAALRADLPVTKKLFTDVDLAFRQLSYLEFSLKFVITARRVCIARTMPSQDVCPSVSPSVTRRY